MDKATWGTPTFAPNVTLNPDLVFNLGDIITLGRNQMDLDFVKHRLQGLANMGKYPPKLPAIDALIPQLGNFLNAYRVILEGADWAHDLLDIRQMVVVIIHQDDDEYVRLTNLERRRDGLKPIFWHIGIP